MEWSLEEEVRRLNDLALEEGEAMEDFEEVVDRAKHVDQQKQK